LTPAIHHLTHAKAVFNNGEFFRAFDLAQAGLRDHPGHVGLSHLAVLSLTNSGATGLAADTFSRLGLEQVETVEMLSLRGRLAKDRAHATLGEARRAALQEAYAWYENALERALETANQNAYYPAINAAFVCLLAGHPAQSRERAQAVLDLLGAKINAARTGTQGDRYWILASAIEAFLLTDDIDQAKALLADAVQAGADNPAQLSATWRQLEHILAAKDLPRATLAELAPAEAVHYLGHIIAPPGRTGRFRYEMETEIAARIEQTLEGTRISVAYGALAAGADIMLAEALLRRGVALHVVLPFERDDFTAVSVRPSGNEWVDRFDSCLNQAASVRFATEDRYLNDDQLFAYGSQLAMGLTVLYARHLHAGLRQIAVWDGKIKEEAIAGTAVDMRAWYRAGLPQTIIPVGQATALPATLKTYEPRSTPAKRHEGARHARAMLFGDIGGFGKLTDAELPGFATQIMGTIGRVLAGYRHQADMINTWGDGIFVVFADAGVAALCALELQEAVASLDLAALGLPTHLSLRLAGHLGPVYKLHDPILERPNFYGAHVSRAARIEPIVPKGCVYVTETFAAVLALSNADALACDYVGWTDMAKKYGRLRMFLLRRRGGALEPTVVSDIERGPVT
jgi:hypothetical protein